MTISSPPVSTASYPFGNGRLMSRVGERLDQFRCDALTEDRVPLGRILLVCANECSTALVADHLGAALAQGNSVVVAFVGKPSASTEYLLDALSLTWPVGSFEWLTETTGSWRLLPYKYVVAVLTALHVVVDDNRRRHGATSPGHGSTLPLLSLYSTRSSTEEAPS